MGADLILTKDGDYVADLGRAYHFQDENGELDIKQEKLLGDIDYMNNVLLMKLTNAIYLMAGRVEFAEGLGIPIDNELTKSELLDTIIQEVQDYIDYHSEETISIGKNLLLANILEDEGMNYRIDY